jgi:spoIIIJ-associated protein
MQNPARLIGREGEVLDDLQFLLNRMLARGEEPPPRVIVDVENFRREQEAALLDEIKELVDRVRTAGETVELPPMNAYERRIIHQAFKDDPKVETVSPEGPARLKRIRVRPRRPAKS